MLQHEHALNVEDVSCVMESIGFPDMIIDACHKQQVIAKMLATDDDMSIKAKLKWSNADHVTKCGLTRIPKMINKSGIEMPRPDKGELSVDTHEPNFHLHSHLQEEGASLELFKDDCHLHRNKHCPHVASSTKRFKATMH